MPLLNISNTSSRRRHRRNIDKRIVDGKVIVFGQSGLLSQGNSEQSVYSESRSIAEYPLLHVSVSSGYDEASPVFQPVDGHPGESLCSICSVKFRKLTGETHCSGKKHQGATVVVRAFQDKLRSAIDKQLVARQFDRYMRVQAMIGGMRRTRDVVRVYKCLLNYVLVGDDRTANVWLVEAARLAKESGRRGSEISMEDKSLLSDFKTIETEKLMIYKNGEEEKIDQEFLPELIDEIGSECYRAISDTFDESDYFFGDDFGTIDEVSDLEHSSLDWNLSDEEAWDCSDESDSAEESGVFAETEKTLSRDRVQECIAALAFQSFY